ncbi:DNA-3-methyladenine glycosylase [bacterium]|nr:DNA-3-methyladenine glycosylase [bacterium]
MQTPKVAQLLLGALLIHDTPQGTTAGRIVETEAYLFKNDPACHAHRGQTKRNAVMFGPAGRAYVYLCYGMYELFNVVTNREGVGEAVLIRALEPLVGIEIMQKRRRQKSLRQLCSGPGKLVQAMGIRRQQSGQELSSGNLRIELPRPARRQKITRTKRIGITQGAELNLRYYLSGSEFVSAV